MDPRLAELGKKQVSGGEVKLVSVADLMQQCISASKAVDIKPNWNSVVDNFAALDATGKREGFAMIVENLPQDLNQLEGSLDVARYGWTIMRLVYEERKTKLGSEMAGGLFDKLYREYADRLPTEWDYRRSSLRDSEAALLSQKIPRITAGL